MVSAFDSKAQVRDQADSYERHSTLTPSPPRSINGYWRNAREA